MKLPKLAYTLVRTHRITQYQYMNERLQRESRLALDFVNAIGSETDTAADVTDTDLYAESALLRALIGMKSQLQQLATEEKNRNWTMEGLARFGELLQRHTSLKEQSYQVIYNLVKYLGANQGGFFLYNKEDESGHKGFLDLIACYAYDRQKYTESRIYVEHNCAEGLIGQAFLEKNTIYLTDIPPNYTYITSGLGGATPNALLIVPLYNNNGTYGVLEIASFRLFEAHQIRFVEKIAEGIASALTSLMMHEKTQQLLEIQAQQREQLMAKEINLKLNLDELTSSHQGLKRVQRELEYTFEAVDTCFISMELSPEGNVLKVNQVFCDLFGYTPEEITGKHHRMLADLDYAQSEDYKLFWEKLNSGVFFTNDYERITKDGQRVWLRATYYPLRDLEGKVIRIIKLGYNATDEKMQRAKLDEQQQMLIENERLLRERTKSVQDKAYQRIKELKQQFQTELDEKNARIEELTLALQALKPNT